MYIKIKKCSKTFWPKWCFVKSIPVPVDVVLGQHVVLNVLEGVLKNAPAVERARILAAEISGILAVVAGLIVKDGLIVKAGLVVVEVWHVVIADKIVAVLSVAVVGQVLVSELSGVEVALSARLDNTRLLRIVVLQWNVVVVVVLNTRLRVVVLQWTVAVLNTGLRKRILTRKLTRIVIGQIAADRGSRGAG
jgi:hypothetical protein